MHLAEVVNGTVLPGFSSIVRNETTDALLPASALSHLHEGQSQPVSFRSHSKSNFSVTNALLNCLLDSDSISFL